MLLTDYSKRQIKRIAAKYGAVNIRLFGSMARGDFSQDSDMDLLVDMLPGSSLYDLMAVQEELAKTVGRRVDIVTEKSLNRHIKDQTLKEAVPL